MREAAPGGALGKRRQAPLPYLEPNKQLYFTQMLGGFRSFAEPRRFPTGPQLGYTRHQWEIR